MLKSKTVLLFFGIFVAVVAFSPAVFAQEAYPVVFEAENRAVLSAERAGVIKKIAVEEGGSVKKGDVIARVDTGELGLRKKRAELNVNFLNSKLSDLTKLKSKGLATNDDVAKSRMERDVAKTDIEILRRQISKSSIRAPYGCVVVKRIVQPHEWVTEGQQVVEVVARGKIQAVANIPSSVAVRLEKGAAHEFFVPDLQLSVTGTVKTVVPVVDELSNTARVIWKIKEPDKNLLAGMKGDVRIGQ